MKFAKNGIDNPLRTFHRQPKALAALTILAIFFLVTSSVSPSMASILDKSRAKMEAILQEAHAVIAQDNPDPAKLRQAISQLEGYKSEYPAEIRFPLYLAEAYYRLADPGADVALEYHNFEKTGAYAEQALALDPNCAEAHYWHGLFMLRKAQKQGGIGAFFTVRKGIAELEGVRQAKPTYDHAGASRVLGLLYYLAPGWTPFGSLTKSIAMEEEATRLAPHFALNRLYLANAYKKQGNKENAIREYKAILTASAKGTADQAADISEQARTNLRELGITG